MTQEENRLMEARAEKVLWKKWGPYLSERQWGTVREDYSAGGSAWEYFPHDHARSRAYRWGEDGIAGISDDKQQLCFALSLWNGKDSILKERLFGLTGDQGNHGEDVKEYYFYLDNLPSHAYMKYLYKYPQGPFPYQDLVEENGRRTRKDPEYELLDTGIFDENRYFDVFVEYAKVFSEDMLIKISVANRGPDSAELDLLPTLWFRNTWSWTQVAQKKPELSICQKTDQFSQILAAHPLLGNQYLYCENPQALLFTENETNQEKIFGTKNSSPYVKDGINNCVVDGNQEAVSKNNTGTKAAVHYRLQIKSGETAVVNLRLSHQSAVIDPFGKEFEDTFNLRVKEADDFYQRITPFPLSDDMRTIQRQAFAGLLWNKQLYHYNVETWLKGDSAHPPPPQERNHGRNAAWWNLDAYDIFSMPDKWEYPWFASWDLAFHIVTLALIDPDFAKAQLHLLVREWYMHPNGQIPAYEWSFSDVNPPVHAWAAMRIFQIEAKMYGRKDSEFLKVIFHKLSLNFTWWVNRKDKDGRNIFEGGFLGLDNIGPFDRSKTFLKGGVFFEQCDGTSWMGMYCLNLLQIALELAVEDASFEDMAVKFFEHFIYIADAINNFGGQKDGLWNEKEGFYYGALSFPDGTSSQLVYNTIIGAVPLFALAVKDASSQEQFKEYRKRFLWLIENRAQLVKNVVETEKTDASSKLLISLVSPERMKRILVKIFDEKELLSPFGLRSVSRQLKEDPFSISLEGSVYQLDYEPAESTTALFGGNSNWRGPIWFPLNYLLIEALQKYHYYLKDDFKIEYPTGSGQEANLWEVTTDLTYRLMKIFLKDENGRRPVYGNIEKFQTDPYWRDYILFHEYFHGENGAGLGASNQTGWTGLIAKLIRQYGEYALQSNQSGKALNE